MFAGKYWFQLMVVLTSICMFCAPRDHVPNREKPRLAHKEQSKYIFPLKHYILVFVSWSKIPATAVTVVFFFFFSQFSPPLFVQNNLRWMVTYAERGIITTLSNQSKVGWIFEIVEFSSDHLRCLSESCSKIDFLSFSPFLSPSLYPFLSFYYPKTHSSLNLLA